MALYAKCPTKSSGDIDHPTAADIGKQPLYVKEASRYVKEASRNRVVRRRLP
jgi:hypothetical protein